VSVRKRKDGRWQIDFTFTRSGRKLRGREAARVRNSSEALQRERERRGELDAGAPLAPDALTFERFAAEFLETYAVTNNKPSEVQMKRSIVRIHLVPVFGPMRRDAIGMRDIERFKAAKLQARLAPKTVNNCLTVLRRILVVAQEWEHLTSIPRVRWLRTPQPQFDFLTFGEAARLVSAFRQRSTLGGR
jgi:hypothetical protein